MAGLGAAVSQITARAMAGELDFLAALEERLALLRGQPASLLEQLKQETVLTGGAAVLAATMRARGGSCYLVSGGFTFMTGHIADRAGFDGHFGNIMLVEEGRLAGRVQPPVLDRDAKLSILKRLVAETGLTMEQALSVGDGANDLDMLAAAGLGVAFQGKPLLRENISCQLNHTDLTGLLFLREFQTAPLCQAEPQAPDPRPICLAKKQHPAATGCCHLSFFWPGQLFPTKGKLDKTAAPV